MHSVEKMRPIAKMEQRGLLVGLYFCLLVTFVSHAKTAESIEILFRRVTQVDQRYRYYVLDGGLDPPTGSSYFGVVRPIEKHCKA